MRCTCLTTDILPVRGIFITGSSLLGAAQRVPRITSKNLIRSATDCSKLCPDVCSPGARIAACSSEVLITSDCTCSIIFCEAVAIYGVIVAIILQTKIESVNQLSNGLWPTAAYTAGYAILGSGLTTGWANLACG